MVFKRRNPRTLWGWTREMVYPQGGFRRATQYVLHRMRRLPDSPHWQRLNKAELAALWQASFDRAEDYSYARGATELLAADGRILAFTTLRERIGAMGAAARELQIEQQAQLRISAGYAVIERLRLDIRDPQR